MLWLGAGAAGRAVRWAWQPGADDDRRRLRGTYAADGMFIGIAVLFTTAAVRVSGWRRLPWAVAALLTWLLTTRVVSVDAVMTAVVRRATGTPPPPEPRTS